MLFSKATVTCLIVANAEAYPIYLDLMTQYLEITKLQVNTTLIPCHI